MGVVERTLESTMPLPTISKRYLLLQEIGRGGMGVVYRAIDRLTGQQVALKSVTRQTGQWQFNLPHGDKGDLRVALAQEFQFLASLRHPNIISVLDYGFDTYQQPFFTMDLLDEPLDILTAARDRPYDVQIGYLIQTLQALSYLHRRGILHRDLKPDNIVITNGQVKLLDFGLSIRRDQETEVSGTLAYMAPEVLTGKPPTVAADLYAVGIIAYELLVGRHPFDKHEFNKLLSQIVHDTPDFSALYTDPAQTFILPREVVVSNVPRVIPLPPEAAGQALAPIVERLLHKEPEKRYTSAFDVIEAINAAVVHHAPVETEAIRESFLQAAQFIGRDRELFQLTSALQTASDGRGSVWLVGGESGVGKTRLLDELRIRALVQGVQVLRGQGLPEGAQPYHYWRPIMQRLILLTPPTPYEASVLQTVVPDVQALVDFPVPEAPPLDAHQTQQRLISVILALFRRQTQSLVVILEDLQWARESLVVFKHLATLVAQLPILLLGSYRDDERPSLPHELPDVHSMKLARLDKESVARLSSSILGAVGSKPDLVELLHQTSEGNVFFLVEVVRALAEEAGRLEKIGEMPLPEHVFARSALQIVERRLSNLQPKDSAFLRTAAVAGRSLDLDVLRLVFADSDISKHLTVGADTGFLTVQEQQWQFTHDQIRNALLAGIDPAVRRDQHRRIATAFEQAHSDSLDQHASYLAHQWQMAGDIERESFYTIRVGEELFRIGSYAPAMDQFRRALEISLERNKAAEQAFLHGRIGELHWRMGEYFQATNRLKTSLRMAQELDERKLQAEALLNLGVVGVRTGSYEDAAESFRQSLALSRELGETVGVSRTLNSLGTISRRLGKYTEARDYLTESLAIARANSDPAGAAYALDNLGILHTTTGDYVGATKVLTESLEILRQLQDRAGIGGVLISLGMVAFHEGDYARARQLFDESHALCTEIGNQVGIANALTLDGMIALYDNRLEHARLQFGESAFIYRTLGDWGGIATSLMYLGLIDLQLGKQPTAQVQLDESLSIYQRLRDRASIAHALIGLAMVALGKADSENAFTHLTEALRTAFQIASLPIVLEALVQFGRWYQARGNLMEAFRVLMLVRSHAAAAHHVRTQAAQLADQIKSHLDTTTTLATLPAADLDATVDWLLKSPL